jgi:DNA-directed RNA polymerase subunit F
MTLIIIGIHGAICLILKKNMNLPFLLGFTPVFVLGNAWKYARKIVEIKIENRDEFKSKLINILEENKWKVKEKNNELIGIPTWIDKIFSEEVVITLGHKSVKIVGARTYVEKILEVMDMDLNSN